MPFEVNRNEREPGMNERHLRNQLPLAEHKDMTTLFSDELAEIIMALLVEDQTKRAGSQRNGSARVMAYSFFSTIKFDRLHNTVSRGNKAPWGSRSSNPPYATGCHLTTSLPNPLFAKVPPFAPMVTPGECPYVGRKYKAMDVNDAVHEKKAPSKGRKPADPLGKAFAGSKMQPRKKRRAWSHTRHLLRLFSRMHAHPRV